MIGAHLIGKVDSKPAEEVNLATSILVTKCVDDINSFASTSVTKIIMA